jgi:DNA polymerase I-like protein with 3'-5' exonuclease and polymerase domains
MRRPKKIIVLKDRDGIETALNRVLGGPLAIDTETTGLDWTIDHVGSINLAAERTAIFAYGDALDPVARWLGDQVKQSREFVMHNAKFDLHFLRQTFGLHFPGPVHDTSLQSFLIDNRGARAHRGFSHVKKPHALKNLASIFVDPEALDPEKQLLAAIKSRGGRTKGDWLILMGTEDERLVTSYGALDPWFTLQLHELFIERIQHWPQPSDEDCPSLMSLYRTEQWVILALRDMEERGIMVARPFLEEWRIELEKKLAKIKRKLAKIAGKEINWNSNPQIKELFFSKRSHGGLGIKGGPSTDEASLVAMKHPIAPVMIDYRETFKQWSSYAVSLLEAIAHDGAIHPSFKSTGARTGRTSCEDPNLQQQTRVSGVRKAYKPRKGLVLRMADYSQVEVRFAAHYANEKTFIKGFLNDPDFDAHDGTARMMFGKSYDTKGQHRKFAKILNFTMIFGGGVPQITKKLMELMDFKEAVAGCRAFHVDAGTWPFDSLAKALKSRYDQMMPAMKKATRREAEIAEHRGFVVNAYGRHRYLEKDKYGNFRWYSAFNTKVQGSAGDAAKKGLVKVYREMQLNRGEIGLMLIIHDELFYESEGRKSTDRHVLELMAEKKRFKIPIIADMSGSANSWQDKEKIKL